MFWCVWVALAVLSLVGDSHTLDHGLRQTTPTDELGHGTGNLSAHGRTFQKGSPMFLTDPSGRNPEDPAMPVKQLNPAHYQAQRAAVVVQHHLNTQHGSPYKYFLLDKVRAATVEETPEMGNKYSLEFSVKDVVSNQSVGPCSAEVLFPWQGEQTTPQVQCACKELSSIDTTEQDKAFYQQLRDSDSLVTAHNIPDSYGNMAPEMNPLWRLGATAASFVMVKESNESTLYNVIQVANITQQESEKDQLMFQYHILLHELVSQEIITWMLHVSWSPAEGVRVLSAEKQPKCHHCVMPPADTATSPSPKN